MALTCKNCGGPTLEWWSQYRSRISETHKSLCRACNTEYVKSRPSYRARVTTVVPCVVCRTPFTRGMGGGSYCSDPCRLVRRREANRITSRRRRDLLRSAVKGEPYTLASVVESCGGACHICGDHVDVGASGLNPFGPTIDHLVPLSRGGIDCATNVALAHRTCNNRKGNRAA